MGSLLFFNKDLKPACLIQLYVVCAIKPLLVEIKIIPDQQEKESTTLPSLHPSLPLSLPFPLPPPPPSACSFSSSSFIFIFFLQLT